MKKLYSRSLLAFLSYKKDCLKALRIFLLAFSLSSFGYEATAQAVIAPANDTTVCAQTALSGTASSCTALGTITITETLNSDFSAGTDQVIINPPTGWQFCVSPAPSITVAGGGEISITGTPLLLSGSLQIDFTATGTVLHDQIIITGLRIQPVLTTAATGTIYASSTTGVAGIVTGSGGTSFGKLGLVPIPISGRSQVCVGDCITLTSSPGVTWTSSNPAAASVSAGGVVCGVAFNTAVTITATLGSCIQIASVRVDSTPRPISIGDSTLCAWYDSTIATSGPTGGIFTSTLVTVDNSFGGVGSGTAKVKAAGPGIGVIRYTSVTGCFVTKQVTVNRNPYPILPLDMTSPYFEICKGSTRIFTCDTGGGTWTVGSTTIATVTTIAGGQGSVFGANVGSTKLIYTAAGNGCKTDTTIIVNPLPSPISGDVEICEGEVTTLASGPCGGTWSSTNTAVADILALRGCGDTVDISGVGPGNAVITYTLPTGCAQITTVTVDPLPGAITGPTAVCVGEVITLNTTSTGGTWTSTNPAIGTVDPLTGDVTGIVAGPDTIVYTLPTGCSAFYVITVNPLPTAIIGLDSMCEGQTATYISFPAGGSWSSSITSVGVIDPAGVFTAIAPGVTSICYTLGTGCKVCKDVTVNALPLPIVGPDRLCEGTTISLSDPTPDGVWASMDTVYVFVDTTGLASTGTVTVQGRRANPFGVEIRYTVGGCYVSKFITVDVLPGMISGPLTLCKGDTATYTDTPGGGRWSVGGSSIATIDSITGLLTAISGGTLNVTYTTSAGCSSLPYPVDINPSEPIFGSHSICKYDSTVLGSGVPGGLWSSLPGTHIALITLGGSIDTSLVKVIGLSDGVETITYETPTGCKQYFTFTVNPIEPISFNSTEVCLGFTDSVWNVVPGGIWSVTPGTKGTISTTGVLTALDTGVVTITYTLPTGCLAVLDITINPNPAPITGDSVVCMGEYISLFDIDTGGVWSTSNGNASIGGTTGVVLGVAAGTSTVTYAFPTGCYTTKDITINALSPISGDSALCLGDTVTLFDTTRGGVWTASNGFAVIDGSTGVVISVSPGVDTIYYTLPTGCQAEYVITVNPLPGPIIGKDSVCQLDTIMLHDTVTGGAWSSKFGFAPVDPSLGVVTGATVGIDSIVYTLPTGCRIAKAVVVNLTPNPIVGPTQVCLGRFISLSCTPTTGYWTSVDTSVATVTATGAGSASVNGRALDTTTIFYTLPIGSCRARKLITVNPIPRIVITGPTTIKCKYASVTLSASGAGPSARYIWSPSYGLSSTIGAFVSANPTVTTTYTVRGENLITGCDSFTTFTVLVDDSLNNMKIVGKDNICAGRCDTLMGSGRAHTFYNWHPSVGLSCTICDTVVACPDTSTTYWAVAIDDLGCKDSVSFRVNVNPIPVVKVDPNPAIVCRGKPLQLWATSTNTDTATNIYTWKPNLFISCDTCKNPIINDTANIVYRVTGITKYGCYDSFDVKVSVLDTNINTISVDTNICERDAALLIATSKSVVSNLDIPTFTWLPNNGTLSNPDSSVTYARPAATTTYSVAIRENACFSDTLAVTVFVEPYPNVKITTSPGRSNIVSGTPVQLIASAENVAVQHYAWAPANTLSCDSCFNPTAIPVGPVTYTVTVTSIYGCTSWDTVSFNLFCDNSQIFIPNVFTPNGDGANDIFYVSGKGIRMITLFQVYNRWGQLVFEQRNIQANDITRGWDGTFKGLVLQPDVFMYVVKAECDLGTSTYTYTGDVSIVK